MQEASQFLSALAQAFSTMSLYGEGHPARDHAVDLGLDRLRRLQEVLPTPRFTFLGDETLVDDRPLRDLKRWDWGERLARAGIQRLELVGPVGRDEFESFLEASLHRLSGEPTATSLARPERTANIRFGSVGLQKDRPEDSGEEDEVVTAGMAWDLRDEIATVEWLHGELRDRKRLHLPEVATLVRSLSVAMHGDDAFLIPLLRLKRFDQYTTTHSLNMSVLSMALAEHLGLGSREVRSFGVSGLLHDMGKVMIPEEILNKPGKLTPQEREVMNSHPVQGARIILETEAHLDLAAVVAYEHHIRLDGGGYPRLRYPRPCHRASDIVHVCDVFDALRTNRPYRDAWGHERVLSYIEEGAGTEFDPDLAHAFVTMMRSGAARIADLADAGDTLPGGTGTVPPHSPGSPGYIPPGR